MKLVYIATDPITAFRLMDGQLAYMRSRGFDVTVITAPGPLLERAAEREGVRAIAIPMRRAISPGADVLALLRLYRELRRLRPTIVNAGTPKAGLLGVLAARLVGVPVVVYLLRGLRFEGTRGKARLLLASVEHVTAAAAHRVFVNSDSLRDRFVGLACAEATKTWVPGSGSSNGVHVELFAPSPERRAWAAQERRRFGIPSDAIVIGFVGRLVVDKGLSELVAAFQAAAAQEPRLRLLLVGDNDGTDPLSAELRQTIDGDPRIVTTGFLEEPAAYYALMDVFAFPSYREGFPNAVLEAAAAGLPTVAFRATGTVDAVVDGETGTLIPRGDVQALGEALLRYARSPELRREQGEAAHARVDRRFRRELVWQALADEYLRLLGEANDEALAAPA